MDLAQRIDAVAADLAAYGITFILDTTTKTSGDAWVDATERLGTSRLAFVHEEHGHWVEGGIRFRSWNHETYTRSTIWVSFDHNHPEDANAIGRAFTNQGFDAKWSGDAYESVEVTLS